MKILVVDDERNIADSLARIMEIAHYEVCAAYSGEEALKIASEFGPDLLFTDVLMPTMNGFELALQVKKTYPNCRLLLFSGQAAAPQIAEDFLTMFNELGYRFELLSKPMHPVTLLKKLAESLASAV